MYVYIYIYTNMYTYIVYIYIFCSLFGSSECKGFVPRLRDTTMGEQTMRLRHAWRYPGKPEPGLALSCSCDYSGCFPKRAKALKNLFNRNMKLRSILLHWHARAAWATENIFSRLRTCEICAHKHVAIRTCNQCGDDWNASCNACQACEEQLRLLLCPLCALYHIEKNFPVHLKRLYLKRLYLNKKKRYDSMRAIHGKGKASRSFGAYLPAMARIL